MTPASSGENLGASRTYEAHRIRLYLGTWPGAPTDPATLAERIRSVAEVLAEEGHKGATILPAMGLWEGHTEPTLVIDLVVPRSLYPRAEVIVLAHALRRKFGQNSILWTVEPVLAGFSEAHSHA